MRSTELCLLSKLNGWTGTSNSAQPFATHTHTYTGFYSNPATMLNLRSMTADAGYFLHSDLCDVAPFLPQSCARCGFLILRRDITPVPNNRPPPVFTEAPPNFPPPPLPARGVYTPRHVDEREQYELMVPPHTVAAMLQPVPGSSSSSRTDTARVLSPLPPASLLRTGLPKNKSVSHG